MSDAGWAPEIIEVSLQHEIRGVRGIYAKTQYLDQRREMLVQWSNMLDAAMRETGNVLLGRFAHAA
jgi:hypothetical protein